MALTESKIRDLADKKFDDLFTDNVDIWRPLAKAAHDYTKENITGGKEPRPDDIEKVLYPMLEVHEKLRAHQEDNQARASRYVTWFAEYVIDKIVIGEGL